MRIQFNQFKQFNSSGFDSFGIKFILSVLLRYQFDSNYTNPRDYRLKIKANDLDMYELL